jgi:phosphatidylserine/phosphatidylglycerophosphate/cardiolipin synthase-like enzyme
VREPYGPAGIHFGMVVRGHRFGSRWRCAAAIFAAVCILGFVACSIAPPKDAVRHTDGLAEVVQRYGIRALDPAAPTPLLKQLVAELEKSDPRQHFHGRTYRLTGNNRLPADWLIQTPDVWGRRGAEVPVFSEDCEDCDADFRLPVCTADASCGAGECRPLAASVRRPGERPAKFCLGHSDALLDRFYRLLVSAEHTVDIALLHPPANTRFLAVLRNAVTRLAQSGRPVTIRVLVGDHPPIGTDAEAFTRELMRDAAVPRSRLAVHVGAIRSCSGEPRCGALSWNHAKIAAVDGRRAIVGGHNMWSADYLGAAPVQDVSMEVHGPAATDAHRFLDELWTFLCAQPDDDKLNERHSALPGIPEFGKACVSRAELSDSPPLGGVSVLAVARLGTGITPGFADHSLLARDLMLGAATKTVRILTQDVPFALAGMDLSWPEHALEALARLIAAKGDVYMILSNKGAAGPIGTYSMLVPLDVVAMKMREVVRRHTGLDDPALADLLCRHLHLAPLRFGPDETWPGDKPIGTHAKFWMIDERAFHIGAENLYPTELQEFGYIVEDKAAAAEARRKLWEPAWRWSRAAAMSGADAPSCVFRDTVVRR